MWVSCLRALPTVLLFGPWLVFRKWRGQQLLPAPRVLLVILIGAIASQLVGNWLFQWSLRVVGLAMAVPLCLGTLICGGALLGRVCLREPITRRVAISLGVLTAAILVLSIGAHDAHHAVATSLAGTLPVQHSPWWVIAGVLAACASGVFFAILGVSIRYSVTNHAAPTTMMFTVGLVGTVGLGAMTAARLGVDAMAATPPADLAVMLSAGLLNALSFIFMTKALQLTNVAYAYALNATQATMGALAGILIFREATTPWLGLGVGLTIAGLLYMSRKDRLAS